jgi:hypothetical protein
LKKKRDEFSPIGFISFRTGKLPINFFKNLLLNGVSLNKELSSLAKQIVNE